MHTFKHNSECYSDNGQFSVMTRTRVLSYEQLFRIAECLRSNAEELVSSSEPATVENCRIAGAMLGWACNLVPVRIAVRFDL